MKFSFVTLFEGLIKPYFEESILKKALEKELISIECINPRTFSKDKHKRVDEYKFGGGAGLLMQLEPLFEVLSKLREESPKAHIIFPSPVAKPFRQIDAKRLAKKEHIVFVCGRYEGIDERVIEEFADELFSVGDFVLMGGELPALVFSEAISRNIKAVLGNEMSLDEESFESHMLEAPSFAKPLVFHKNDKKLHANSVFLKGNHARIANLKFNLALCKTKFFRPDLYRRCKIEENHEKQIHRTI
ncbi:tRNA (guanosine(37)-N1)-methyltransferase TrmD [Campylobacter sp. MIT 99-7217]|uniref:tRNA (guanosine(37)-N1)-methyltransferase TrmD n=1 Tax=Campylobacter sp. MIT 99-7217 TaxID=535091 RepID=UPI00115844F3|nr:tRNA (guanosine(37)-N1)-methyltransferase TrmD [Campylobacter sp. MIT 99-7217]TQR34503.1 tRNA (guanosine(37)-N1)-methyltransferase TrmD [Campylobacter sp. MIT 99-7217]